MLSKPVLFVLISTLVGGLALRDSWIDRSAQAAQNSPAKSSLTWKSFLRSSDLVAILSPELESIQKTTASSSRFRRGANSLVRSGNRVLVIGNIGTIILEGEEAGKAAALRQAGLELVRAASDKNHLEAKKAAEMIAAFPDGITPASQTSPEAFEDMIELESLMLIVNSIDDRMTKLDEGSEEVFVEGAEEMSPQALLLAALAIASREYEDDEEWDGWCDDMSRSAVELSVRYSKRDAAGAKEAFAALQKSCRDCHKAYGIEDE